MIGTYWPGYLQRIENFFAKLPADLPNFSPASFYSSAGCEEMNQHHQERRNCEWD